jgi:hypothetical protein
MLTMFTFGYRDAWWRHRHQRRHCWSPPRRCIWGGEKIPAQWSEKVLTCRPETGNPLVRHPRPECFWPVDALHVATSLVGMGRS